MGDRAVGIGGLFNARDLGGLQRLSGGTTPSGVFIRSELPDLVTPSGWERLVASGVRTVLDLRQDEERSRRAALVPPSLDVRHVDLDGIEHEDFWAGYWDNGLVGTPLYYLPHLAALPDRTVRVLHELATAPDGAVLFHCAGGRDRTGLIAAVLLRIAGVGDDAITADYLETIANAEALSAGRGRPDDEAAVAALLADRGTDSEEAFRAFLAGLDVESLLRRLPEVEAESLRTWRGTLPL